MAWLNAAPKPPEGSRRVKMAADQPKLSRLDMMKRDGVAPPMPYNPAPHLIERLIEIGLTEAAGMGASPISWREINEWQRATGVVLPPWEARLLRSLSVAYLAESRRAEVESCPAPWRSPRTQVEVDGETARLRLLLG